MGNIMVHSFLPAQHSESKDPFFSATSKNKFLVVFMQWRCSSLSYKWFRLSNAFYSIISIAFHFENYFIKSLRKTKDLKFKISGLKGFLDCLK